MRETTKNLFQKNESNPHECELCGYDCVNISVLKIEEYTNIPNGCNILHKINL